MGKKYKFIYLLVLLNFVFTLPVLAMSSANYEIVQDSINFAGSDEGSSTNYLLEDTLGEIASGPMNSANFLMEAGYRQTEEELPYFSFSVATANKDTKIAYTAYGSTTVTLSSVSGFVVDDYIAVSEDWGANQEVVVGRITNINGNVVTVDNWSGDTTTISATPVGIDDFAYKLTGNYFDLGILTATQINTGISFYNITTSGRNGYSVQVYSNHGFQTITGATLAAVSDNAVTAGVGEYGIRTVGDDISTSTIDFGVSTTARVIATSSISSQFRRAATVYKASVSNQIMAGHYTQAVSYIATLNF